MSLKAKLCAAAVLVAIALSKVAGASLLTSNVGMGSFLFGGAMMIAPFVAIVLIGAAFSLSIGVARTITPAQRGITWLSKGLFAIAGVLMMASLVVAGISPTGELLSQGLPVYLLGTVVGLSALAAVIPQAHFAGIKCTKRSAQLS